MSTPSRPQDFKKKLRIGELVELPSGLFIKVKGVDLTTLVTTGKIPNTLLKSVQGHLDELDGETEAQSEEEAAEKLIEGMDADELKDYFEIMDALVVAMAMEPAVYPAPASEDLRDDERLYVDELSSEDKLHLFNWSQGGTRQLKRFPGGSEGSMAPVAEVAGGQQDTLFDVGSEVG